MPLKLALADDAPHDDSREVAERLESLRRLEQDLRNRQPVHVTPPRLGLLRRVRRKIGRMLAPQLGNLIQHPPCILQVPERYLNTPIPNDGPAISLVTPSYNQAEFLEETMRSVLQQGYPRLEYIVRDGGSTDDTVPLLERTGRRLFHWESSPDRGQANAINLGFRHASGEIMGWLNSDDMLVPGTLSYVGQYFRDHPEVDVVYGHRILVDDDGGEIGRWVLPPHDGEVLRWADYIPQETLFWRRSIWDKVGGALDESFQFALDWDLLLRFQEAGARFVRLPRFLGIFRVHPQQKTQAWGEGLGQRESTRLRRRTHGRHVSRPEISAHLTSFLKRHQVYRWLYRLGLVTY